MNRFRLALIVWTVTGACGDDTTHTIGDDTPPDAGLDSAPLPGLAIAITAPEMNASFISNRSIVVTGTLAVTNDTISAVDVTVGTTSVAATFDAASFTATIELANGPNAISATAHSATGITARASVAARFPFVEIDDFDPAEIVLGQSTFTTAAPRTADRASLRRPYGHAAWGAGYLFVPSLDDNRAVVFHGLPLANNEAADFAVGQLDLTAHDTGPSAERTSGLTSIATDGRRLVAIDQGHHRVLVWNEIPTQNSEPADLVLGAPSFTDVATNCVATELSPSIYDATIVDNKLLVSDTGNHRVLIWSTFPTRSGQPPDLVLGQADYEHCVYRDNDQNSIPEPIASARTFNEPSGMWTDGTRLAIADTSNNRVLIWSTFPTSSFAPADIVLGQPSFITHIAQRTRDRFTQPRFVTSNGNQLFVADTENNRVLVWDTFPTATTPPDHVLGQADFVHFRANDDDQDAIADATPSKRTVNAPHGLTIAGDALLVADSANNRVLAFGQLPCAVNQGLIEAPAGSGHCVPDPCAAAPACGAGTCDHDDAGALACRCPAGFADNCAVCAVRVSPAGSGDDSGATWSDAAPTINAGVAAASRMLAISDAQSCELWLTDGTYYARTSSAADTFAIPSKVGLYGGFAGDEVRRAERHGGTTILDGRNNASAQEAVHHVVTATGDVTLDRLAIQHGSASDGFGGGGVLANGGTVTITDATLAFNRTTAAGGAFAGSRVVMTRSSVRDNAAHFAGGLVIAGGLIEDTAITNNTATDDIGGLQVTGNATLRGLTIVGNRSGSWGGGLYVSDEATVVLEHSLVARNAGVLWGGVWVDMFATLLATSCTIADNAGYEGAIILVSDTSVVTESILWAAPATYSLSSSGQFNITYSASPFSLGSSNIAADPDFVSHPAWVIPGIAAAVDRVRVMTPQASNKFVVGDTIEINNDGVGRTVISVTTAGTATEISFSPANTADAMIVSVAAWGSAPATLEEDYHLASDSACRTASMDGGEIGAYAP